LKKHRVHLGNGQAAGVRRQDGVRGQKGRDLLEQLLLDAQVFDDRFDHQVAIFEALEMVIEIARLDQTSRVGIVEGGGLGLERLFEPAVGEAIASLGLRPFLIGEIRRHDVEQVRFDACPGQVRRNRATHDSCSDHGSRTNGLGHRKTIMQPPHPHVQR
jgi:hypothetical protein